MPACQHCGREVMKLLQHGFSNEMVCLKCMTKSGFFSREIDNQIIPAREERRTNIRIPVSIVMSFDMFDPDKSSKVTYPALSVNLSTAGICFAWEHCSTCLGYEEGGVHENCMFYPFYHLNENAKELDLTFSLTPDSIMQLPCNIVYTVREKEMDIEYVGAAFTEVSTEERRVLELIVHKYGKLQ